MVRIQRRMARQRLKRVAAIGLIFSHAILAAAMASGEAITPDDVRGPMTWGGVDNVTGLRHLYFSAQPDQATLEHARRAGVVAVIDLRDPSESDWDERGATEALGMAYYSVPVSGEAFNADAMNTIEQLVADYGPRPVLLHCSSSNRAGGWLATHMVREHGASVEDALAVGRKAGITKPVVEESVRRFVEEDAAASRARDALAPFKKELKRTLTTTLQKEGPLAAVDACRMQAPAIASSAAQPGVAVGRTSHKLRNRANAPAKWMQPLLDDYRTATAHPATPRMVRIDSERWGYVEPIYAKPLCLSCHGENVAAPLLDHIRERYPDDEATGFALDELRGLFWAEVGAAAGS